MAGDESLGVSRRSVLKAGAVAGAAAAAGGLMGPGRAAASTGSGGSDGAAGGGSAKPAVAGNVILRGGEIHTMDEKDRVVDVVAIRDGVFVYAGNSYGQAVRQFDEPPRTVDLGGRTAVPGLIDCHNHVVLMGNRPGHHTPLENAYSIADVQAIYRERARGVPAGEFITTIGGFHFNQFNEVRLPTLAELDAALPNNPCYISLGFVGPSVTNSLGKAYFTDAGKVPPPYGPVTVGADGSIGAGTPTGQATLALRSMLTFERRKQSVLDAMAYATSMGITTHLDQGAFQATNTPSDGAAHEDNYTMHLPFLAVYDEGKGTIRLRINFLHMDQDPDSVGLAQRLLNAFPFFGNDLVRTGAIGEFVAPDPTYPISVTTPGFPLVANTDNNTRWLNAALKVARAGWRAEVHSLTSSDFKAEIDGYLLVNDQFPVADKRWVVAHVPQITAEYADKLKSIGGGVNLTGWQYLSGRGPSSGPPYRMLLDNGIPVGMSSDGMQIAPMNPWIHAFYATTGLNALGNQINVGQQITRHEVLEHYTRANGWFLGGEDENQLGVIQPGRLGDVAVLSHPYFDTARVDDATLKRITSVLTVLGGTVVHDSGVVR